MHILVDGIHLSHRAKGVGLYTRHVLERWMELDPDLRCTVVIRGDRPAPELPPRCRPHPVPWRNHLWFGYRSLPQAVQRIEPDGVWMPCDTPTGALAAPFAMVCHDIPRELQRAQEEGGSRRSLPGRLRDRLSSRLWAKTLGRAERVFCNSHYVADHLTKNFGILASRTTLAPCAPGTDYESLSRHVDPDAVRQRLESPNGYILTFYTGDPRENPRIVPQVFDRLARSDSPPTLVVAGLGPDERAELENLYRPFPWFDRLRFEPFFGPDQKQDLAALYTSASVYFDPTLQEGFGMQVVEAMACGTPVVCSDRSALPEVTDGAAQLVDPTDSEAMAEALGRVLQDEDLRRTMVERGRRRARDFDWDQTAKTILEGVHQMVAAS